MPAIVAPKNVAPVLILKSRPEWPPSRPEGKSREVSRVTSKSIRLSPLVWAKRVRTKDLYVDVRPVMP